MSAIGYGPLWESIAKVADRDKLAPDHPLRVLGEAITSGDDEGFAIRWLTAERALREYDAQTHNLDEPHKPKPIRGTPWGTP